jgi:hypothetical protein
MRDAPQEIRTFFVTSIARGRDPLFKREEMARLLLDVLQDNRRKAAFFCTNSWSCRTTST